MVIFLFIISLAIIFMSEITVEELRLLLENGKVKLIDVREQWEHDICKIKNSQLIPLDNLLPKINEFDKDENIVFYCHTDNRSSLAVQIFKQAGFKNVKYLKGGIDEWAEKIEPSMARD